MNSIMLNELCIQHQVSYFVMKLIIKFWVTFIPFFSPILSCFDTLKIVRTYTDWS